MLLRLPKTIGRASNSLLSPGHSSLYPNASLLTPPNFQLPDLAGQARAKCLYTHIWNFGRIWRSYVKYLNTLIGMDTPAILSSTTPQDIAGWNEGISSATAEIRQAAATLSFTKKEQGSRRGAFNSKTFGISYGNGRLELGNIKIGSAQNARIVNQLLKNPGIRRVLSSKPSHIRFTRHTPAPSVILRQQTQSSSEIFAAPPSLPAPSTWARARFPLPIPTTPTKLTGSVQ
ncbi:hypothetical protein D9758_017139 [Tetrapyrgos nigripes]|uniref:Uncharacterized protein n=1 Tax=Tetrapyrgos nigripes TaxID=182062 RepID=A0A8H5F4M3_9AGAR|nr:hypothetical protein D9758_017139 [Tetrapyrgos nigripes]